MPHESDVKDVANRPEEPIREPVDNWPLVDNSGGQEGVEAVFVVLVVDDVFEDEEDVDEEEVVDDESDLALSVLAGVAEALDLLESRESVR